MENVVGEQDIALQEHFPWMSSKVSENSNCRINFLFNARSFKLGYFGSLYVSISGILQFQ